MAVCTRAKLYFFWLAAATLGSGCGAPRDVAVTPRAASRTARALAAPPACSAQLAPGSPLQTSVDALAAGAVVCLQAGTYQGPLTIRRSLTLVGPAAAIVRSSGTGTTISVASDGVTLRGFSVDGSGARYDTEDSAVAVRQVHDVRIEGLRVVHAVFGILAERSNRLHIADNEIWGDRASPLGLRGDGIRLWEVRESTVEGNRVHDSRDLVIWYAPGNVIRGNLVERGRYGTHLMYSHGNLIENNVYRSNVVGLFSMYSRELTVRGNQLLDAAGPGGMGLGAKEASALVVQDNVFVHNEVAVYLDTTPLEPQREDRFERNLFALGQIGVVFHGRTAGNQFVDNSFEANQKQVQVEGGGDAKDAHFLQNFFDDYRGYDLDDDGMGDVPYELRSLVDQLTSMHASLAFFDGTTALGVVEALGRLVPLFSPKTLLVDPRPRVSSALEVPGAR